MTKYTFQIHTCMISCSTATPQRACKSHYLTPALTNKPHSLWLVIPSLKAHYIYISSIANRQADSVSVNTPETTLETCINWSPLTTPLYITQNLSRTTRRPNQQHNGTMLRWFCWFCWFWWPWHNDWMNTVVCSASWVVYSRGGHTSVYSC